jgi:hypothetical protein
MSKDDPAIETVRAARRRISEELGNDPSKVIDHYIEYQKKFGDRLQPLSSDAEGAKAVEEDVAPDARR